MKKSKKKREKYTRILAIVICAAMALVIILPVIFGA